MKKQKGKLEAQAISAKPLLADSSKTCPYDDHACRVYSFCGTKKCNKRKKSF